MDLVKAARLVASLQERRKDMKRILGSGYAERVRPFRQVLRGKAAETKQPIVEVALELSKELDGKGHDPNLTFCALVDECESPEEQL